MLERYFLFGFYFIVIVFFFKLYFIFYSGYNVLQRHAYTLRDLLLRLYVTGPICATSIFKDI